MTKEVFLMLFVIINLRSLDYEYVIMLRKKNVVNNSEHIERIKMNYC